MKYHYLTKSLALAGIIFVSFLARTSLAGTEFTNEFWVSTSTNTANLGTLDNPFDCSTAALFDMVLSNLPPNCTLHILGGTYQTAGPTGWHLKDGQKLLGSGIDTTIIQLVPYARDGDLVLGDAAPGGSTDTNIEIADLTCDCNYQSGSYSYGGIFLAGTNHLVQRVKVIHLAAFGANQEMWGINVGPSFGCTIEDCEVSQARGGGTLDGFAISGGSGIMRDNHVLLPPSIGCTTFAFNGSFNNSVLIDGNYVDGASVGIYNDTGGNTNVIIVDNTFKNVYNGVYYFPNGNVRQNVMIQNNIVMLTTNAPYGSGHGKWAFEIGDDSTNVSIIGNIIGFDGDPQPGELGYDYFITANSQGILVADNRVDARIPTDDPYMPSPAENYVAHDNYDFTGNLLTNVDQELPPTNTFYISAPDAVVQMWGGGSVNVNQFYTGFMEIYGWCCSSNANASIFKPIPLPAEYWGGRTTFVTSWKLLTTNSGFYEFNIGVNGLSTNDMNAVSENPTASFTSGAGTNVTTISVTNVIGSPVDYLQAYIYTADQVQPGNYVLLGAKVTAQ